MSNEDWEESRKKWNDRLASGEPMHSVLLDLPLKVTRDETGALMLDSPTFGLAGFDRLGIQRVLLTPDAAKALTTMLAQFGENSGFLEATKTAKN